MPTEKRILSLRMKGDDVKALQNDLIKLGYKINDNSRYFGKETRKTVKEFQVKHGLDETGEVEEATAMRIKDELDTSASNLIKILQPDPEVQKQREAPEKTFDESIATMKKEAVNGKFSSDIFEKYFESGGLLQTFSEDSISEIFDTLLDTWKIHAFSGELNLNDMENYMAASKKLSWPIQHDNLKVIMNIAQETRLQREIQRRNKMTDEEYVDLLKAAADEYIRLSEFERLKISQRPLNHAVDRLSSTARFARVVGDRTENAELCNMLANELSDRCQDYDDVVDAVETTGILDALRLGDGIIIRELRPGALPADEMEHLRRSGVENPESLIKLIAAIARSSYSNSKTPETIFKEGRNKIGFAINSLPVPSPNSGPQRNRKICSGISRILGGAVLAGANIWGAVATGGAAAAALGSVGASVVFIGEGIGNLRGE